MYRVISLPGQAETLKKNTALFLGVSILLDLTHGQSDLSKEGTLVLFLQKCMHILWTVAAQKTGTWGIITQTGILETQHTVTLPRRHKRDEGERRRPTYQEQGHCSAQDETGDHIRTVVPVLWDPVEARQEGCTEGPQTQYWLGQPTALGLDCACDVHLQRERDQWVAGSPCPAASTWRHSCARSETGIDKGNHSSYISLDSFMKLVS